MPRLSPPPQSSKAREENRGHPFSKGSVVSINSFSFCRFPFVGVTGLAALETKVLNGIITNAFTKFAQLFP